MKTFKSFAILLAVCCLCGCAATSEIYKVSLGMTEQEVVNVLGEPQSVSFKDNAKYLQYRLNAGGLFETDPLHTEEYYVRLVDGKVEAYGKAGDLDYVKPGKMRFEF